MIEEQTIWAEVWPVVENLLEATLAEDAAAAWAAAVEFIICGVGG